MAKTLELSDILETCTIAFKQRVANLIKFGNKGRLLMIRQNAELESTFKVSEFKSAVFELENKDLETKIKQALKYSPSKLILFEYKDTLASVIDEVKKLKFDWFFHLKQGTKILLQVMQRKMKLLPLFTILKLIQNGFVP